jgi:hypothetical protein
MQSSYYPPLLAQPVVCLARLRRQLGDHFDACLAQLTIIPKW